MRIRHLLFLFFATLPVLGAPPIKLVASTADLAELAKIAGGDKVEVSFIVKGPQNPHYIDVKPSYMMKLRSADIFLIVGMQLEIWAQQIIDGSRNANLQVVDCSRNVPKLEVPTGRMDASEGDVHPLGNPHYWLDPTNVRPMMEDIVAALTRISPSDEVMFRQNMAKYLAELDARTADWKQRLAPFQGTALVTYHSSFSYFMKRFGLVVAGQVEPKPGIPPTPSHTAALVKLIRDQKITVIGVEQFFEEAVPTSIAGSSGARVVRLCTSVGGRAGTDSYMDLIEYNVAALAAALGGK
jgi:zinc/manganese transport system substrate-binding protein